MPPRPTSLTGDEAKRMRLNAITTTSSSLHWHPDPQLPRFTRMATTHTSRVRQRFRLAWIRFVSSKAISMSASDAFEQHQSFVEALDTTEMSQELQDG